LLPVHLVSRQGLEPRTHWL